MTRSTSLAATLLLGTVLAVVGAACGGGDSAEPAGSGDAPEAPATDDFEFPADVPFDPSEWTTRAQTPIGAPEAIRSADRTLVVPLSRFMPTLRTEGPNTNLAEQQDMHLLLYERMIVIDPETEEFVSQLASHWKIETDEEKGVQTFWYRIDEDARFSDGSPVTARDVYASWWHRTQEDRNDPMTRMTFHEDFEEPEIVDRFTIKVTSKEMNWRLFMYFGDMWIYKAAEVMVPGKEYLEDFNWKWLTGTGPYVMTDLKKGESITLTRRDDWWAESKPESQGLYNFAHVKYLLIRERELVYEKFKKGELEWFRNTRAQRWVVEVPQEEIVKQGWVKRRRIFTKAPVGFGGFAFNMRKPPFDDRRMRLAFAHLFNREELMETLFFDQYEYTASYFPARDWGAGDENEVVRYDPDRASELLAAAGYENRDADGFLVGKDGKRLEVTLFYGQPALERIYLIVQKGYEDAGVKFNLELIDPTTLVKKITERQFTIHHQNFGSIIFPNPETSWRSDLADKDNNNNIPGFKSAEVDALLEKYNDVTLTRAQQKEITREIDRLIFKEHPYALDWHASYLRILLWDHLGHPDSLIERTEQYPHRSITKYWWYDADKAAALDKARAAGEALPQGEIDIHPWKR